MFTLDSCDMISPFFAGKKCSLRSFRCLFMLRLDRKIYEKKFQPESSYNSVILSNIYA